MRPRRWMMGLLIAVILAVLSGYGITKGLPLLRERKERERLAGLLTQASQMRASTDLDAAVALLDESVDIKPTNEAQTELRGIAASALGPVDRPELAERACQVLLRCNPDNADTLFASGLALARQQEHLSAAVRFGAAAEIRAGWPEASANQGLCLLAAGDAMGAAKPLESAAAALGSDNPELISSLGQAYLRQVPPCLDEAEDAFDCALTTMPTLGSAKAGLGIVEYMRGNLDAADELLAEAELISPLSADVLTSRGAFLARVGRTDEAEAALHRALAIEPGHATARYNLGCLYLRSRQSLIAQVQFRVASEAVPDDPLARLGWAMSLRLEGRDDEARYQLSESLRLGPPGGAAELARAELLALESARNEPMSAPGESLASGSEISE